jgi:ABC-type transport system involved in Fe-S cluster assembly fused permease/ATPase subunit
VRRYRRVAIITFYSPGIAAAIFILWAISMYVVIKLVIQRIPIRRTAVAEESKQTGELADAITNAVTVHTFGAHNYEAARYHKQNEVGN